MNLIESWKIAGQFDDNEGFDALDVSCGLKFVF